MPSRTSCWIPYCGKGYRKPFFAKASIPDIALATYSGGKAMNGTNGSGHGLVGMEERMRLYDGTERTGRVAGGGFEVVARLPL